MLPVVVAPGRRGRSIGQPCCHRLTGRAPLRPQERPRGGDTTLARLAEGEELGSNLLHVAQSSPGDPSGVRFPETPMSAPGAPIDRISELSAGVRHRDQAGAATDWMIKKVRSAVLHSLSAPRARSDILPRNKSLERDGALFNGVADAKVDRRSCIVIEKFYQK
jgi:hypothetical protein